MVIATWVLYRLIGRLKEIILWILIAAFVALVLNPAVAFLQRHRMRRGVAVLIVYAIAAVVAFFGLLGLFGYPLVNSVTHVATQLPTMVKDVEKGHGWLAHTLAALRTAQVGAEERPEVGDGGAQPGQAGPQRGGQPGQGGLLDHPRPSSPSASCRCSCQLEAPRLRRGFLGTLRPDRRRDVEDIAHTVSRSVTAYVLGTVALSFMFGRSSS